MKNLVLALLYLQLAVVFTTLFHLINLKMVIIFPSRMTLFSLQLQFVLVAWVKIWINFGKGNFLTPLDCHSVGQRDFYCWRWANKHIQLPKSGRDDRTKLFACTYYGLHRICFFLFNPSFSLALQLPLDFRATSKIYFIQPLKIKHLVIWAPQAPSLISTAHPFPPMYMASIDVTCFLS